MTSSGCQEKGIHQVASLKNLEIFSSKKAGNQVKNQNQCLYSLYNHCQELQKAGTRIGSKNFFHRGCKTTVEKERLHKCQTCGISVSSSQSWHLAALAGGFHELQGEQSHIISRTTDPKSAAEDWINNCLESMLTLLARGESFSHGSDSDGVPITSDYFDAVFSLEQDDIQLLMPEQTDCTNFARSSVSVVIFVMT